MQHLAAVHAETPTVHLVAERAQVGAAAAPWPRRCRPDRAGPSRCGAPARGGRRAASRSAPAGPAPAGSAPRCAPAARGDRRGQVRAVELDRPGHVVMVRAGRLSTVASCAETYLASAQPTAGSRPLDRHPRPRPQPRAQRAARRPDARRPRRRDRQGRAARRRHHPLRHAEDQRRDELLRPAEQRQAQRQPRHERARGQGDPARAGRALRRAHRELPPRRGDADGHRLRRRRGAQPAHRLRLDQRLRADRSVGGAQGVRLRWWPPRSATSTTRPPAAVGSPPTTRSATPTCTPGCRAAPGSWPRCTSASGPGAASTSTCRWAR